MRTDLRPPQGRPFFAASDGFTECCRRRKNEDVSLVDGDGSLEFRIRRSDRARRMRLRVLGDGTAEVVLPRRAPSAPAMQFVRDNVAWIERQRQRIAAANGIRAAAAFESSGRVSVDGVARPVRITRSASRAKVVLVEDGFRVEAPDLARARAALTQWCRRRARQVIADCVAAHASRMGVSFACVRIGDPRTRWGSCSPKGSLSFSWRLLMAPPGVRDYVVIHELCHLKEMNHGRAFWKLVGENCPDYKAHRKWLRENGPTLVL